MDDNQKLQNDHGFDYEGKAKAVRKAQRFLHIISNEDLDDPDFGATQDDRVRIWREALDAAYPSGFWTAFNLLREKDYAGLPLAIEFLEADPWFFRTGYFKERLIRHLIRFKLSTDVTARLQNVVLTVVDKRYRREFRAYCRLARKIDSPEFRQALYDRLIQSNPDIRRRAQWVLDGLQYGVPQKGKHRQLHISHFSIFLSPAFLEAIELLRSGDFGRLEWAMEILEERHLSLFKRDGLLRGKLISVLADIDLPQKYKSRLHKLVLSVVDTWYVYGFDRYCQLARRIDSPGFRSKLTQRLTHPDYHVKRRTELVLNAMKKNGDQ